MAGDNGITLDESDDWDVYSRVELYYDFLAEGYEDEEALKEAGIPKEKRFEYFKRAQKVSMQRTSN